MLTLFDPTASPISIQSIQLDKTAKGFAQLVVNFQVDLAEYTLIDTKALFNLQPDLRGPFLKGDFLPIHPIKITAVLHPDHLPEVLKKAATLEVAVDYLEKLSTQHQDLTPASMETIDSLLKTENWLALTVQQIHDDGETGYSTFWDYIDLAHLQNAEGNTEQIAGGITQFFQDWTESHLTNATQELTGGIFSEITSVFDELAEAFKEESLGTDEPDRDDAISNLSILTLLKAFFDGDDWSYIEIAEDTALQLAFRGQQGRWNCYAQAREAQSQVVFYSIVPIVAPEEQRLALAEFLTRANCGLIIGNFEFDFADGEIRYKTSLDIEGMRGEPLQAESAVIALIRNLVYANIATMDNYLPGIMAVLNSQLSPVDAITKTESL